MILKSESKGYSHALSFAIQGSGWGWGPASNGKTLFTGSARSGGCRGGGRLHLSRCGGAVWGERCQRGQMVAAVSGDRQCGGQTMGGWRPLRLASERDWLLARIAEKPDLTPAFAGAGSCGRWWPSWPSAAPRPATARCGAVSGTRASRLKKSLHASEQDRVDIARRRARWKMHQGRLDPRRLVFLDETWAKTNMTRRHGHCAPGPQPARDAPARLDYAVSGEHSYGRSSGPPWTLKLRNLSFLGPGRMDNLMKAHI